MVFYGTCRCSVFKFLVSLYMLWFAVTVSEAQSEPLYYTCPNTTTFTPNSTYQANLNTLLSTLSSNNTRNDMFHNATAGSSASDRAYGLFMCRGDVTLNACHDCVVSAAREIISRCPREKVAYLWYDDCMLRYSGEPFFSTMDASPGVYLVNTGNETQSDRLEEVLANTMSELATRASGNQSANHGQLKGFATGEANLTSFRTLYNLVQCTPDLSGADCNRCFRVAIGQLPACCTGRPGGRVLFPSCNIRYEMYPFYNSTATPPPPAVPPPPPRSPSTSGGNGSSSNSTQVIIGIVVPVVIAILLFALGFFFLRRRAKKQIATNEAIGIDGNEISTVESLQYGLSTVEAATNNFSAENKVGAGGFGDVFKGTLPNGQEIAVKKLSKNSGQGDEQFKNEVLLVSKLQHRNLVRLVGFCMEQEEKILIYEYMANKSLDNFLFDPERKQILDWSTRYNIIRGITLGILYLHEDSRLRIIHRDLKASNILLDGDLNAKISDFGMSRIFYGDQSQENTSRIVGTYGYMSPEYAMHGQFSVKSDIFSFGVLLLEIISGKKNNTFYQSGGSEDLLSHAWKLWNDRAPLDLVDPILGGSFDRNEVIRCIHIGLLCVQEDPEERPTIASVVLMLNSYTVTLELPHRPAFFMHSRTDHLLKPLESDEYSNKSTPWSGNETSITEVYPR